MAQVGQRGGAFGQSRMFAPSSLKVCRTAVAASINVEASSRSPLASTEAGTDNRGSQPSGSASDPNPSSEPPRKYSMASRISANSTCSGGTSLCGESASIGRRPGAHVVKPATISFSLSNSSSSSAGRATNSSTPIVA